MGFTALPNTFAYGPRNWSAATGSSDVDFSKRRVYAPTDLSDASRYRRLHANATVRAGHSDLDTFSETSGVPLPIAHAVDYARISSLINQHECIAHNGEWDDYEEQYDGNTTSLSRAVSYTPPRRLPDGALAFYEANDDILAAFDTATRALHGGTTNDWLEWHHWLRAPISPDAPDAPRRRLFKQALRMATHAVGEAVAPYEDDPTHDSIYKTEHTATTEAAATHAWEILSAYLDRETDDSLIGAERDAVLAADDWDDLDTDGEWCDMRIVRPTLVLPHAAHLRRRAWRMSDEGALLRSPHRACSDGRVFGSIRRKRDSGSVLIDTSGSMSIRVEDIDEIMNYLPGVTVATYCSDAAWNGELRIIAAKGRRAPRDQIDNLDYYGNGVDGPALRWLAKQPAPRYWICDGHVTGVHDKTSQDLREECQRLTKRYSIDRIDSMYALRERFATEP